MPPSSYTSTYSFAAFVAIAALLNTAPLPRAAAGLSVSAAPVAHAFLALLVAWCSSVYARYSKSSSPQQQLWQSFVSKASEIAKGAALPAAIAVAAVGTALLTEAAVMRCNMGVKVPSATAAAAAAEACSRIGAESCSEDMLPPAKGVHTWCSRAQFVTFALFALTVVSLIGGGGAHILSEVPPRVVAFAGPAVAVGAAVVASLPLAIHGNTVLQTVASCVYGAAALACLVLDHRSG